MEQIMNAPLDMEEEFADVPDQMIFEIDKTRLSKLVRNADTVEILLPNMGGSWVSPQKGSMLKMLANEPKGVLYLAVFNGLDLSIYGQIGFVDGEEGEQDQ